ncbi:MAG: PGDYG domain-containing protein [Thiobacillus sp.]
MIYKPPNDISEHPDVILVEKLPIPVKVKWTLKDDICLTQEGAVAYHKGDPILTGVENEQWTIPKKQFLAMYEPITPTINEIDGYYRKIPRQVYALKLDKPLDIKVGFQKNLLHGEPGDWLLQYEPGNFGIVAATIFEKTYRVLEM